MSKEHVPALYIAGGSSERLTVCQPRIDRAIQAGATITYDWTRTPNYDVTRPSETSLRADAARDVRAVLRADVLWILAPQQLSEGASTELGLALGARGVGEWDGHIVISGEHARRNIFALLADAVFDTHDAAWEAIKTIVVPRERCSPRVRTVGRAIIDGVDTNIHVDTAQPIAVAVEDISKGQIFVWDMDAGTAKPIDDAERSE